MTSEFSLTGQLLVAMPGMADTRFAKAVIYLCEHSSQGAMGLVINKRTEISMISLFERVDLRLEIDLPADMMVLDGGPVASERGFVLHSNDRVWNSSLQINNDFAMTTSRDILASVAKGEAPSSWLITLGYAGWSEGQLESELAANAWLNVPASREILFESPIDKRFEAAYQQLGIDPLMMSDVSGRA